MSNTITLTLSEDEARAVFAHLNAAREMYDWILPLLPTDSTLETEASQILAVARAGATDDKRPLLSKTKGAAFWKAYNGACWRLSLSAWELALEVWGQAYDSAKVDLRS